MSATQTRLLTAHWTVAAIYAQCPHCDRELWSHTGTGRLIPISDVDEYKPGRVVECLGCFNKFRLPGLRGAHGTQGRGYS